MVRAHASHAAPLVERLRIAIARPVFELAVAFLIVISIPLIFVESTLDPASRRHAAVATLGDVITALLAGELFVRWLVASSTARFVSGHALDLIALLPILRPLRAWRVLAVLRLMRLGHLLNRRARRLVRDAIAPEYMLVAVIVAIVVMTGALGMHTLERATNPHFDTLEKSLWWSLYTLMASEPTGGEPVTRPGRALAAAIMMSGLTMFAMLTGVVSATVIDRLRRRSSVNSIDLEDLRDHIVIAGYNRSVGVLVSELHADPQLASTAILIVSEGIEPATVEELEANRDFLHFCAADYTRLDVLERIGIRRARMCILLADSTAPRSAQDKDARTVLAAMLIERLQPGIFTCAQLLNSDNEPHLRMLGVEEVVLADQYAGTVLASSCRAPGIVTLARELFSAKRGNQVYRIAVPATWVDRALTDVLARAKAATEVLIVSVVSQGRLIVNPPSTYRFSAGDEVLVMAGSDPGGLPLARIFED